MPEVGQLWRRKLTQKPSCRGVMPIADRPQAELLRQPFLLGIYPSRVLREMPFEDRIEPDRTAQVNGIHGEHYIHHLVSVDPLASSCIRRVGRLGDFGAA